MANYVNNADLNAGDEKERRWTDRIRTLLFFAYRDFTAEVDARLLTYGYGRAHHRVLHFVEQRPGLAVADLLETLQITKQSLARVLKQLVERGLVVQRPGPTDRRQRRLFLTDEGRKLARALAEPQSRRIEQAMENLGEIDRSIVERFLVAMVDPDGREIVARTAGLKDAPESGAGGRG